MYTFDPERLAKVASLRAEGINPWPHGVEAGSYASHHSVELKQAAEGVADADLPGLGTFAVSGRLMFKNEMGKAGFGRVLDQEGRIQFYVRKDDVGDATFLMWKRLDLGDVVGVAGPLMRTRTGELSIKVERLMLLSKCMGSLPDKFHGLSDPELRQRQRYVDLFVNEETRAVFLRRSQIVRYIRNYFEAEGFIEVETPMMQPIPGGATARPFVTHHNALDAQLYLRVAPELYLKRLVVGGLERVFEINRNFRNEGIDSFHNPEFTMLEFYEAYATWQGLMVRTETLISGLVAALFDGQTTLTYQEQSINFGLPWRRATMAELISEATGLSAEALRDPVELRRRWCQDHGDRDAAKFPSTYGKWWEWYFDAYVERGLVNPTFMTGFPVEISPLARRNEQDPELTDRFELFIAGREFANGFNELNDPVDQAERFAAQASSRNAGDNEAMFFDDDYVNALSYGLPPTAGEGLGIDRLVMLLTDSSSIRDVILFPLLRPQRVHSG